MTGRPSPPRSPRSVEFVAGREARDLELRAKKRRSEARRRERATTPVGPRQTEVLELVAAGWTNSVIAKKLWLSEETVKSHVQNLLRASGTRNRAHLTAWAFRNDYLR